MPCKCNRGEWFILVHSLSKYSPSWLGEHKRVYGGKSLWPQLPMVIRSRSQELGLEAEYTYNLTLSLMCSISQLELQPKASPTSSTVPPAGAKRSNTGAYRGHFASKPSTCDGYLPSVKAWLRGRLRDGHEPTAPSTDLVARSHS